MRIKHIKIPVKYKCKKKYLKLTESKQEKERQKKRRKKIEGEVHAKRAAQTIRSLGYKKNKKKCYLFVFQ